MFSPSRASVLQVDSSVIDHNRDEILVQAQGLYAGVALLNELEPLSETPGKSTPRLVVGRSLLTDVV